MVISLSSSSTTPISSTKAPRVPEPDSRETTVMGPEAEVPSAEASEEDSLSEALLSEEALLVEELLSEAELSAAEELLLLLPPQPASMEAHRVSAKRVERTFFMVMTFLLHFLVCPFSLPYGIHDIHAM